MKIATLLGCVLAIASGQILFKIVALRVAGTGLAGIVADFRAAALLVLALGLYAAVTPAWIWVLRSVPLGQAYLFMSLSFAAVPLMAHLVLGETLNPHVLAGSFLIVSGVAVTARGF